MKRGFAVLFAAAWVILTLAGTAQAFQIDVPEIDPNSTASALTLLAGASMLVADQIRRKAK